MRLFNPIDREWLPEDFGKRLTPLEFIGRIESAAAEAGLRPSLGAQGELLLNK